jgi:hypothetical protein
MNLPHEGASHLWLALRNFDNFISTTLYKVTAPVKNAFRVYAEEIIIDRDPENRDTEKIPRNQCLLQTLLAMYDEYAAADNEGTPEGAAGLTNLGPEELATQHSEMQKQITILTRQGDYFIREVDTSRGTVKLRNRQ